MTKHPEWPHDRWRGQWVWHEISDLRRPALVAAPGADSAPPTWVLLRRQFELDQIPERALARVTADSRYVLRVNDVELARGPIRSHPSQLRYDQVDLASALQVGTNVVSAVVRFYSTPTPWWMPVTPTRHRGAGGFLFEAEIDDAWVVSDSSWRVFKANAWSEAEAPGIGGPPEILDARELPQRWQSADFDDSGWSSACELPANHFGFNGDHVPSALPYGPLLPRPIEQLGGMTRRPVEPLPHVVEAGTNTYVFDFGQIVSGSIVLDVDSAPGAEFKIGISEGVETAAGLGEIAELLQFTAPGGRAQFESFDSFGFRYAYLTTSADAPASIEALSVQERLHPREEGPFFASNDPLLDKVWAVGRRTLDICSHDAYIDCPTREQRAWVGDAAISQAVDLVSNSNWDLARWNIEMLASPRSDGMLPMAAGGDFENLNFTYIPDFSCHWIHALEVLSRYTGDNDQVTRLLPVAENILRWFANYQRPDGLLADVTGWVFIDWAAVSTAGRSAALNGLWARALEDFAKVSDRVGDAGRAAWARRLHSQMSDGYEQFWDPHRSLYVDHIVDGVRQAPTSQHSQAAALVGSMVPADRRHLLVRHLVDSEHLVDTFWGDQPIGGRTMTHGPDVPSWDVEQEMVKAQPGFRSIVHDALVIADGRHLLPEACREWALMLDRCETSFSETWTAGTISHAWSATPTRDLIIYTAGITPEGPGFSTVRVAPCLGDLEWIRAATPTPSGLVGVEANANAVVIDSPIPIVFDPKWLWGGEPVQLDAGRHSVSKP